MDQRENDDEVLIVPVPALVAVLLNREREMGRPLTEDEVIGIRDSAECIAMPVHAFEKVEEGRGYVDIDPENVWAEWQTARVELIENT